MRKLLITGGSSDIAHALILAFDKDYDITYTCSSLDSLKQNEIRYQGFKAKGIVHHFDHEAPKDSYDILILNACSKMNKLAKLEQLDTEMELDYIKSNLKGNLSIIKSSLESMRDNDFGRIVLISSISTIMGTSKYSSYIMLKSALEGLMTNIAVEYGASNILANTLRLGLFKTSRNKMIWKREAYQNQMNEQILTNRMGNPEDIIAPVRMLIAESSYITGTKLEVSGGLPIPNSGKL